MLPLDDPRWTELTAGYRVPYDPRPALDKLASGDASAAWEELWQELHHQGDVGEASYASVPHLVRIHAERAVPDWNTHALAATIEFERGRGRNPPLPDWLREGYEAALGRLAEIAMRELPDATDPTLVRCLLTTLALNRGLRTTAEMIADFDEEELEAVRRAYNES